MERRPGRHESFDVTSGTRKIALDPGMPWSNPGSVLADVIVGDRRRDGSRGLPDLLRESTLDHVAATVQRVSSNPDVTGGTGAQSQHFGRFFSFVFLRTQPFCPSADNSGVGAGSSVGRRETCSSIVTHVGRQACRNHTNAPRHPRFAPPAQVGPRKTGVVHGPRQPTLIM